MDWFRWWHGTLNDPKFKWVARKSGCQFTAVITLWVALLERASSVTDGDADVTRGDVTGFDCDAHDALFDVDDGVCARIYEAFVAKGLIENDRIVKWGIRQSKREDSSAERMRALRERRKSTSQVTNGDADVTSGDARVTQGDAKRREEERRETIEANASVDSAAPAASVDLLGSPTTPQSMVCPAERIVQAYHELMPDNPRVKVLNGARRRSIAARWKEAARLTCKPFGYSTVADGIEAWRRFFTVCAASPFLTGKAKPQPGKPPFVADIDFLTSPDGFAKCLENKYHRDAA
jgi:hypothetical protein